MVGYDAIGCNVSAAVKGEAADACEVTARKKLSLLSVSVYIYVCVLRVSLESPAFYIKHKHPHLLLNHVTKSVNLRRQHDRKFKWSGVKRRPCDDCVIVERSSEQLPAMQHK